ncbi:hypothetical protein KUTeg_003507 [Tegillarca granosa]|uniref:Hexosyltransferase n=1 Tax=Tegillarca granosa TaxID=220873 RepID=A0ABQ9FQI8_TEGGR|nr:hypothetical protein KUTeg_003507 [Tegillarca granosa]
MIRKFRRLLKPSSLIPISVLFLFMAAVYKRNRQIQLEHITGMWKYRELSSDVKQEIFIRKSTNRFSVLSNIPVEQPKLNRLSNQTSLLRNNLKSNKIQDMERKSIIDLHRNSEDEYKQYFRANKKINPFKYDFMINGSAICNNTSPFLIILIPSIPGNKDVRDAIRTTWGSVAKGGVWPGKSVDLALKLAFLLGMSEPENLTLTELIFQESLKYGDLIQGNFTDSYYNLTLKILLGLKWVTRYCNKSSFVVKADEDTFVNLPKLVDVLKHQYVGPEGKIFGCFHWRRPVLRYGKWKLDESLYPFSRYPNYVSGGSYFISNNIVPRLFLASEYFPYIFIEDAFITGILKTAVNAKIVGLPGVTFWGDKPATPCDFVLN